MILRKFLYYLTVLCLAACTVWPGNAVFATLAYPAGPTSGIRVTSTSRAVSKSRATATRRVTARPRATSTRRGRAPVDVAALLQSSRGHTLERHVGKDVSFLRQRLERESISSASSFTDLDTAVETIGAALAADWRGIQAWLRSKNNERYTVVWDAGHPVGISLRRGASRTVPASRVRVVLVKERSMPDGFFILTAYPEL